jgi:hypothetical protein
MTQKNPFPGMNPFMEQTWPDVHMALLGFIREVLGEGLPDDLQAKGEMRVTVLGGDANHYRPDVPALEARWKQGLPPVWSPDQDQQLATVTEPVLLDTDPTPHRWIEIRSDQGQLVTVIELLSPANKTTGRESYIAKRQDLLDGGVNVVEIDLVRQGSRTVNLDGTAYSERFGNVGEHYSVCVTRSSHPNRREVYVSPLRQALPTIRIPLRLTDADLALALQPLVDRCYTTGRYWKLDHSPKRLRPALSADDANWATGCWAAAQANDR